MAITLKAAKREDFKKSATKQLRLNGEVPSVVYGKDTESKAISVNNVELVKTVRDNGRNTIISLDIENDKPVDVMLHEYQVDPLKDEVIHADFYIVNMDEAMDVSAGITLDGEPVGEKEGGVLQQTMYEVQVRAKPADIPDNITVDVSEMEIGDTLTVSDLPKMGNYEFQDEEDTAIATITPPDSGEEAEDDSEDENAEPELVDASNNNEETNE